MRYWPILFLVPLLISCIQQPNYAQQCANIGYSPGTQDYADCQMSLYQQRQQALIAIAGMRSQPQR